MVYVGSADTKLYAVDAKGCGASSCAALWTAATGAAITSSPAVANGVVFVGSGTVEAGCKAIIGQRLKLSGMRWNIPGATGILTLRCHRGSNRWEEIWPQPDHQIAPDEGRHLATVHATAAA